MKKEDVISIDDRGRYVEYVYNFVIEIIFTDIAFEGIMCILFVTILNHVDDPRNAWVIAVYVLLMINTVVFVPLFILGLINISTNGVFLKDVCIKWANEVYVENLKKMTNDRNK